MLRRIGTGIVGGVAGITIGVVISIASKHNEMDGERILMTCGIAGAIGLILGFVLARPKKSTGKAP
jgi:ABC-type cobalamin transport system permease subunit